MHARALCCQPWTALGVHTTPIVVDFVAGLREKCNLYRDVLRACNTECITFFTSLCIMVESWTEPFAYLVTRRKLYYVITSHMSTQMKVHRWQKNCKRSCFKKHSETCQQCKYLPNTARSSHHKPSTVGRRWYSRNAPKIAHNILFHQEKRSLSSHPILGLNAVFASLY